MEPESKWWQRHDPVDLAIGIGLGVWVASFGIIEIIAAIKG